MSGTPRSRVASFGWVALAYAAGAAVAAAVAWWAVRAGFRTWAVVAAADAAATLAVFAFSRALDNSSVYDPYWSVAPMAIAPSLALVLAPSAAGAPPLRRLLVVALVLLWGARLTWNWARGWQGLHREDWRYADLRAKTGRGYWAVSLLGFHLMPTLSVYLGCLSLLVVLGPGPARPLGWLDLAAAAVTAGAIALEAGADQALRAFRLSNPAPGKLLATGVWRAVRHPNYTGEIGFWWGLFLFALAADPRAWWAIAGPVWITTLFVFISVPMMDKRGLARRPAYRAHMERVPALVPWPFGRSDR